MAQSVDALVVGAGPVGLTMAAALNRHHLRCRLIDKAPAPTDKSKALVIWSRTLELFEPLGLSSLFIANGHKLSGATIYANRERLLHLGLTGSDSPYGFPLILPQSETERLLTGHLSMQGIEIERQVELISFTQADEAVKCVLKHADGREELFSAPWLIGCDGSHSTVRHELGIEFSGAPEPNDWLLADVHIDGPLSPEEVSVFWHDSGVLALFPITRERFRIVADTGAASQHGAPASPTLADVQAIVDRRGPAGLTLSQAVWISNFRINERKVSDYRQGRAFLAGDAAHIHSPAGGQGMNTGMQDAFNLAWKLALVQQGTGQPEPLLQSYSIERGAVADQVLRNAARLTTIATLRSAAARLLRNHLAPILGSFQFVQEKIRDDWFELSVNYRHSPLSVDRWPRFGGGLAAGDRLCNVPLVSAGDGRRTALFDIRSGQRFMLLMLPGSADADHAPLADAALAATAVFPGLIDLHVILAATAGEGDAPSVGGVARGLDIIITSRVPDASVWIDDQARAAEAFGVRGPTLILVRPDGYIGLRCQPASGTDLVQYLDRFCNRAGV